MIMQPIYRIHPAIGLARVGDSPSDFYLGPETAGGLPIACDEKGKTTVDKDGKEEPPQSFKDSQCRIKRQAARFKIFVYDDQSPEGRKLAPGDPIQGISSRGKLVNIEWTVYLANKKSVWHQFKELEGEHGYAPDHPPRNADVTDDVARQRLIIDPGPQTVWSSVDKQNPTVPTQARFARGENPGHAQSFPPALEPQSINALGEILTDGDLHLLVLGGHGNSGSYKQGFGHPRIDHYANNDGWFDDLADGPVTAKLHYVDEEDGVTRHVQVNDPAWVIVGQPSYVPELTNLITVDDVVYDLSVRHFALDPYLYGTGPFDKKKTVSPDALESWRRDEKNYNPNYFPLFYKEIWPLLQRPHTMHWLTNLVDVSSRPHETGSGGNFDESVISVPPFKGQDPKQAKLNRAKRMFLYRLLRQPGEENRYRHEQDPHDPHDRLAGAPRMPLLCGDNPLSNTLPAKFLRLTDTHLFLLRQWAEGLFINEKLEAMDEAQVKTEPSGLELDRAVLSNALGGAFCPGGEVCWIIRNPAIYKSAYRINAKLDCVSGAEFSGPTLNQRNKISTGLEPGDLTKYGALPWQADFNECSYQTLDVTYEGWSNTYLDDPDDRTTQVTLWWPAHRPMQVRTSEGDQVDWSRGIPQSPAGDLRMVTAWKDLGFVINISPDHNDNFVEVERNNVALGGEPSEKDCSSKKRPS